MSTPDVTITLGRTGRVVKRKRGDSDAGRSEPSRSAYESHRRGDDRKGIAASNGYVDKRLRLGHKDLRSELIEKRRLKSNKNQTPVDNGKRWSDAHKSTSAGGTGTPINTDTRLHCDPWSSRNSAVIPYSPRDNPKLHPVLMRDTRSSLARDKIRVTSPPRTLITSASVSPPTYQPGLQEASNGTFLAWPSMKISEPSRPLHPLPMRKQPVAVTARPMPTLAPSSGGTTQGNPFLGAQPLTVFGLLSSIGLAKYAINFQAEEVDMAALKQMGEKDLKDIGIPMGPRKKILQALMVISKRQLRPPPNQQL